MNIFFHVTTAVGIAVALTDTAKTDTKKAVLITGAAAFVTGVLVHGILDYMPHTYPFAAKVDAILGLLIIAVTLFFTNRRYVWIMALAFLGCVFPDLVDLSVPIVNKYTGLSLPVGDKIFPWHQKENSGSIFTGHSTASDINHVAVLLITVIVCLCRRADFKRIMSYKLRIRN
jgi:hypothetical protein